MKTIIPLIEFTFDENNPMSGMKAISMVEDPAIESKFQYFNNDKPKPQYFKIEGYEGYVQGLALIPDKMIYRLDSNNNPYYGYFSVDTIKKLKNKFHKELMTNNINTDHSNNTVDGYLTESYIIQDEHQLASVKSKGIEDATLGSWFVQYKIEDEATFKRVVDGELAGFSIEAFLHTFLKVNNKPNKIEEKMNKLIEKFEALLNEMKGEKFETAKIYDGVDQVEWSEIGAPVNIILPDGNNKLAEAGSYITDTEKELMVDAAGNLMEIKSVAKEISVDNPTEVAAEEVEIVIVPEGDMLPSGETKPMVDEEKESMKALIASLQAELESMKKVKSEMQSNFEKEIEVLKKAPLTNPVIVTKEKAEFNKEEFAKLSVAEKIAIKNGIELPKNFAKK